MGAAYEVFLSWVSVEICTQRLSLRLSWKFRLGRTSRQTRETVALDQDVREAFVGSEFAVSEVTERVSWES